jgi:curved DNA-binding protein
MVLRDYYEILGIDRGATNEEIKQAYRRLARLLHPDQNPDPIAADRFKQVGEAYRILSSAETRLAYDRYGHTPPGSAYPPMRVVRTETTVVSVLRNVARNAGRALKAVKGADIRLRSSIAFMDAVRGYTRVFELPRKSVRDPDGLQPVARRLEFRIPAGVAHGEVLRWQGEGAPGTYGAPDGNLYVTVEVQPHAVYARRNEHVVVRLPLRLSQLIAGATIEVPTVHGLQTLVVPAGTPTGAELRIAESGIRRDGQVSGDAIFIVDACVPRSLERDLLLQLRAFEDQIGANAVPERQLLDRLLADIRSEST